MKKLAFLLCLVVGPILPSVDALDLTPHAVATTVNNMRVNRYFFDDSGKKMAFRIDNKMTIKGTGDLAIFKFTDLKNAEMQITKSPKKPEAPFGSEKDLEAYRGTARALIPGNATDIQIDRENPDAVPINGWTSYQFVFSYKLFGLPYHRTVTFLNYNRIEQLVVDVSAPAPEFDRVSLRGYQVLNSLSELSPDLSGST